jgi:hypothetical protein
MSEKPKDIKLFIGQGLVPHPVVQNRTSQLVVSFFPGPPWIEAGGSVEPIIMVQRGLDYTDPFVCLSPSRILNHRPHHLIYGKGADGAEKLLGIEQEPAGWFQRTCAEAHCGWFVPFVERMAAGDPVPIEELTAAYRLNNDGKEMPQGRVSDSLLEPR